jgi:hypothetical protein
MSAYAKDESSEHHVPMRMGRRIAQDHLNKYGNNYYKAISKIEHRLEKQQKARKK